MQLAVEECSQRTAGAISGDRRAADRGFGLTGQRQAGGHAGEAAQRLEGSDAGGFPCGEKPGCSTGSRLHTPPRTSPGGHLAPRMADAGLPRANGPATLSEGGGVGESTTRRAPLTPSSTNPESGRWGPLQSGAEGGARGQKCYSDAVPSTRKPEEWGISVPTQPLFLVGRTASLQTGSLEERKWVGGLRDSS